MSTGISGNRLHGSLIYGFCGFILPAVILGTFGLRNMNLLVILLLVFTQIISARLAFLVAGRRRYLITSTFFMFVLFWFCYAPTAQILYGQFYWAGTYTITDEFLAFIVILTGILFFEIGVKLGRNKIAISHQKQLIGRIKKLPKPGLSIYPLAIFAVFASAIGISGYGFTNLFITRAQSGAVATGDAQQTNAAYHLIYSMFLRGPSFVFLLFMFFLIMERNRGELTKARKFVVIGLFTLAIIMNVFTNFPLALARFWLAAIFGSMILVFCRYRTSIIAIYSYVIIGGVFLLFPITSGFRSLTSVSQVGSLAQTLDPVNQLTTGDFDAFQTLMNSLSYVHNVGLTFGSNFAGAFLFWVPRVLWSSKPLDSGPLVATYMHYFFLNLSMPLWGESYLALGIPGAAIVFFIYGMIIRKMEISYSNDPKNIRMQILVPFWAAFQTFFLRGDLTNGVAFSLPIVLTIFVFIRNRSDYKSALARLLKLQ